MTSHRIRVFLPGSKGKVIYDGGRVKTIEEKKYAIDALNEMITEELAAGMLTSENFVSVCKTFSVKKSLCRKSYCCPKCNTLFTIYKSYLQHSQWCGDSKEHLSCKISTKKAKSASVWSSSSVKGLASDLGFSISSQMSATLFIETSGFEIILNEDSIDKEFRKLHLKLKDPKYHDLELFLQNEVISCFVRCTKLDHKMQHNPLWIAGQKTKAETDTALVNPRNDRTCALVQFKRRFEGGDLTCAFNQQCADMVAFVQSKLGEHVDFEDFNMIQFGKTYHVPLAFSVASSYVSVLYLPDGIDGATIEAISNGRCQNIKSTDFVQIIANDGSEWFNLHNKEDFFTIIQLIKIAESKSNQLNEVQPIVTLKGTGTKASLVDVEAKNPIDWTVDDVSIWLNKFDFKRIRS